MIKVLVIDDSALVRATLQHILDDEPDIQVVGAAEDPYFARDLIKELSPDVITLDVEMPRMDGITFLKKLMAYRPIPTVMISSLTQKGAKITMEALAHGAVDFVGKPIVRGGGLQQLSKDIVQKVRIAALAQVQKIDMKHKGANWEASFVEDLMPLEANRSKLTGCPLVCIGASTGGPVAIETVLKSLPVEVPGIVIVQHMPAGFTTAFAKRLDNVCSLSVVEGENGMAVKKGQAIVAPGGMLMELYFSNGDYAVRISDTNTGERHKPSVNDLFRSAARVGGANVLAILMTGMGDDGAKGMVELFNAGAITVAQDESSCVVYGMPREAVELGGVCKVVPLSVISEIISRYSKC